jgi:hypothetical protein
MPELFGAGGPIGTITAADEIEQAALSTLTSSPIVGTSGTLGVVTVEIEYRQVEEGKLRKIPTAALPLISVSVEGGSVGATLCNVEDLEYNLVVKVITRSADVQAAYRDNRRIRDESMAALREAANGFTAWLSSEAQTLVRDNNSTLGKPDHGGEANRVYTVVSESSMNVLVRRPIGPQE